MNFYDRKISCFLNVWNISESEIFLHSFFSCKDFKLTILIRFCFQLIIAISFHIKKKNKLSSGLLSDLSQMKMRKIEFPVIRLYYARRQLFYSSLWSKLISLLEWPEISVLFGKKVMLKFIWGLWYFCDNFWETSVCTSSQKERILEVGENLGM